MTQDVDDVILTAVRESKTGNELKKIGHEHGISPQTMAYHRKKLLRQKRIRLGKQREEHGKKPETTYELNERDLQGRVKDAILKFRDFMQRNPDSEELAREAGGITPKDAEKMAYESSLETHWHNPTGEEKERARGLVFMALRTAGYIKQNVTSDFEGSIPEEERRVAEHFIRKYPETLPTIVGGNVVGWPPKAKEFLTRYFDESRLENAVDQG